MAKFHVIPLRSLSTFLAVKALVLWLIEPFPNMPLIVLSNKHILHILYTDFTAPKGAGFCYFPESNAKALSTGYALSKVPLRPAGFFRPIGRYAAIRLFAVPSHSCISSVRNSLIASSNEFDG